MYIYLGGEARGLVGGGGGGGGGGGELTQPRDLGACSVVS